MPGQRRRASSAAARRRAPRPASAAGVRGPPHVGVVGAVHELQRLGQELHVDQAAAAELDVPAAGRLLAQLDSPCVCAPPRISLRRALGQRRAIHEPPERRPHPAAESSVAEDEPGPRQRLTLPEIAVVLIVPSQRVDADAAKPLPLLPGRRRRSTANADAGRGDVAERAGQALDRVAVERVDVDRIGAVGRPLPRPRIVEDDEQVEIGSGGQLAPAELADADDHRGHEAAVGRARHAVTLDLARPAP